MIWTLSGPSAACHQRADVIHVVRLIKTTPSGFRVASFLAQDGASFEEVDVEISPSTNCLLLVSL